MKKHLLTLIGSLTLLLALTACGTEIMATAPADVGMEANAEADGHVTGINDQNVLVIYSGSDANLEAQLEALFGPAENTR